MLNRPLREAIFQVVDFWLELGVDGMRLDGIPYLVEREGTSCDNLPETHDFIRALRKHIDDHFTNCMLLAEANQWPVDSIDYFGKGDECHMAFHFPIMPRLFISIQLEDCFPLIDIIHQTPEIPENSQWALFLRNHDELTLEMVTDEERDYMYRTYAQESQARLNLGIRRRLAPLLGNDRRKIELMNGMLFSLAGTPFIYYADEIGMGDNIYLGDRNGVRTPMQWNIDRNAGFSQASSQKLCFPITMDPAYSYETVNVETEQQNPNSLLWWMKRLIALRKRFAAFGRGSLEFLPSKNPKIIAFIRRYQDEIILIVGNFSRSIQYCELDLTEFAGVFPYELFGRTRFPKVEETPYFLTLSPYSFYWFGLHNEESAKIDFPVDVNALLQLEVASQWSEIFEKPIKTIFEAHLLNYLKQQPWLKNKEAAFRVATIQEVIPFSLDNSDIVYLTFIAIEDDRGSAGQNTYLMPLIYLSDAELVRKNPEAIITHLKFSSLPKGAGAIFDALYLPRFYSAFLQLMVSPEKIQGKLGGLVGSIIKENKVTLGLKSCMLPIHLYHSSHGHVDVHFAEGYFLKVFRFVEFGSNPEVETEQLLTEKNAPFVIPAIAKLNYHRHLNEFNVALLQKEFSYERSAWQLTLSETDRFFERLTTQTKIQPNIKIEIPILEKIRLGPSEEESQLIGPYLEWARMIAQVTAQMHGTLSTLYHADFTPEEPTPFYLRSNFQSKRNLVYQTCQRLLALLPKSSPKLQQLISQFLEKKEYIIQTFEPILHPLENFLRIRCHGDYHLGQLLFVGQEIKIFNFSKGANRSFSERKRRRSALRDVAGMIRSFHFAIFTSFIHQEQKGLMKLDPSSANHAWPTFWQSWVAGTFIKEYRNSVKEAPFIPHELNNFIISLQAYLLETAIEDLSEELHKPHSVWLEISLGWALAIIEQYPKIALSP